MSETGRSGVDSIDETAMFSAARAALSIVAFHPYFPHHTRPFRSQTDPLIRPTLPGISSLISPLLAPALEFPPIPATGNPSNSVRRMGKLRLGW